MKSFFSLFILLTSLSLSAQTADLINYEVTLIGPKNIDIHHPQQVAYYLDYFQYLEQVSELPEMLKFFSEKLGKYPFSKDNLGLLQTGKNKFATGQTNLSPSMIEGDKSAQLVYGLMKSWFGDYIVAGSTNDQWLYDGFCLYAIALWNEHKFGSDEYQKVVNSFKNYDTGILYSDKNNSLNADNLKFRSAYLFHMLRGVLGDKQFFETLKSLLIISKIDKDTENTLLTLSSISACLICFSSNFIWENSSKEDCFKPITIT